MQSNAIVSVVVKVAEHGVAAQLRQAQIGIGAQTAFTRLLVRPILQRAFGSG